MLLLSQEVYGVIAREVKDRLNMLAEHRPVCPSP